MKTTRIKEEKKAIKRFKTLKAKELIQIKGGDTGVPVQIGSDFN